MTACWRYGVLFCNSFMVFGVYYFMEIPVGVQNEIMNSFNSYTGLNTTKNLTNCRVCLGLGEVRYNLLFSVTRWTTVFVCVPSGLLIDRLGNCRSAILFSMVPLIGSVFFAVGVMSNPPVTTPIYILMAVGYGLLAFGDGALRFVQARVVSHYFPEATFSALAFNTLGFSGQGLSLCITPIIVKVVGLIPSVWLGTVACGFGVMCAVCLTFLLQLQSPLIATHDETNKILSLTELRKLPVVPLLFLMAIGFTGKGWLIKQANLPDYLQLRHGYSMIEASSITGISPFTVLLSPFMCVALKKLDCHGIMITCFQLLMVLCYALLGFCPVINVAIISALDGIGIGVLTVMLWHTLVVTCPASYVGSVAGLLYLWRNTITAMVFIASGYILQRNKETEIEGALIRYQNLFVMLMTISVSGTFCGAVFNVLDIRKACVMNARIGRWRQSDTEAIGLMSMIEPSSKQSGMALMTCHDDDTVKKDSPMTS